MDIYVSTTGSDTTGDGSQSNPYRTLKYTLENKTSDNDTVLLEDGTYEEDSINISLNGVTIKSVSEDHTKVSIVIKTFHDSAYFSDFLTVINGITLKHLTFKALQSSLTANPAHPSSVVYGNVLKITYCYFYSDWSSSLQTLDFINGYNSCYFYKNTFRAYNYTINSMIRRTQGSLSTNKYLHLHIRDCILENLSNDIDNSYSFGNTYIDQDGYNNLHNVSTISFLTDSNNTNVDPLFLSSTDSSIRSGTLIDGGVTVSGYVETYEGSAPDIGVYETSGYVIKGRVTLNGSPIQGAIVRLFNITDGTYEKDTTTDSSGNYELGAANGKKYHVFVEYTDPTTGDKFNALSKWDISPVSRV